MQLYLLSESPFASQSWLDVLTIARSGSGVLFIQNAVYTVKRETSFAPVVDQYLAQLAFYVLLPDLVARGISTSQLLTGVEVVNYQTFVQLTLRYTKVISW